MLFGGANLAVAEESGGFVGFGIGGGETKFESKVIEFDGTNVSGEEKFGGINYGFVGGYKQFFTPYLGLRYYVNVDLHHNLKKWEYTSDEGTNESHRPDITLINYGVNVDFLGNFVSSESVDFGGFVGVGIGATTLVGKFFDAYKENGWTLTGFDLSLNLGLRTNIATNHGLEVVARVPFLPVKIIDGKVDNISSYKITFKQDYNILARYTFSF